MSGEPEGAQRGLRVQLMRRFLVRVDDREVPAEQWRLRRSRQVVALLALSPDHRLHRDAVIEALWPDGVAGSATNSLNQVLHVARRALDPVAPLRFLALDGELLTLARQEPVAVDVDAFERAVQAARRQPSADAWRSAASLYGGALLPEDPYEEWVLRRRDALEMMALEALDELATSLSREGDEAGAREARARRAELDGAVGPAPEAEPRVRVRASRRTEHNLPVMLSSFVGRDTQITQLAGMLERSRLLTLSGPGGAGKTRLACEVARRVLDRYEQGAWFVDLAAISDSSLILTAMCEGLHIRPRPGDSPLAAVVARLQHGPLLLLVDNCEHVLGACAEYVETLLHDCPTLTVLATSREPLRVAGEVTWRTPSLTLPPAEASVADLVGTEAGRLLVDRARAVDPGFAVSEADAADAALLCRRLDGLPLAIELAAARLGSLGPRDLLERLDARFGLLTAGSRTAMSRQQTLAATLDWSHDLLAEPQRAVLRRLSVFAGGFELTAAEAVAAMPPVTASEMAGLVADLVDKSLVGVESVDGRRRHRLLETIREYGRGRLAEAGELETTARRHAQWCLELAEQAEPMLSTHEEPLWLRRLEAELDNLRAALRWSLDREPELYGRLAAALGLFWLRRLRISEAIGWLDAAAERVSAPTLLRVRVLCARTAIDVRRLGHTNDWSAVAEAAEIAHSAGDALMEGRCLLILGSYQLLVGLDKGYTAFDRAREHGLRSGLPQIAVSADACRAVTHGLRGDDDDAEAAILETLEQVRRLADSALVPGMVNAGEVVGPRPELGGRVRSILEETMMPFRDLPAREAEAHVVAVRGVLARMRGDMELAELLLTEALEMSRRLGDTRGVADNLARGGQLALVVGDLSRARTRLRAALHLRRGLGDARLEGLTVSALGTLALAAGDHARASRLHDMALTRFRRAGDRPGMGNALMRRGDLALVAGDLDAAEADYRNVTVNTARYEAWTTFCLAEVAEARGHADQARALLLAVRDQLERGYGRRARAACDARLAALEVRISGA